jgi:Glycosyl transferase family 2.
MKINVGIFAHNEQRNIANIIADIESQTILKDPEKELSIFILANGCTDETVSIAVECSKKTWFGETSRLAVYDLPFSGKSRTWNYFIHEICKSNVCDAVIFVDADIRIREKSSLARMVRNLFSGNAHAINSKPVKDIDVRDRKSNFLQKAISASGGSFSDYKSTICGQLYAVRMESIREIFLPIGLPVEDGFIRAMIISNFLTSADDKTKINGCDDMWHEYESIRSIRKLIRHQQRIIVGSAINACIFREIRREQSLEARKNLLKYASENPEWLNSILKQQLPTAPYGYVPFHFLTKRQQGIFGRKNMGLPKKIILSTSGFLFDLIVYVAATFKLARGNSAGFW